ncbi:MAG TPA: nitrate- and nitrite sensing domain-containing protein, partial [Euzebya sp.]|nr:nitrate- and nitrite sensing domain-containing protein [Euzebya sp.]
MALLLVPAAGLLGVAGLQLGEALTVVGQTAEIESLTQVAQAERNLLHSLQIERTRSLEYIALLAGGVPSGATEPLQQARTAVEAARSALDATLGELDLATIAPDVLETDEEAKRALAALQPLRFNLDAGRAEGQNVIRSFDDPIEALLQVDQRVIALIDQPAVRDNLQGSLAISQIKDAAIRSGDVVLLAASGAISQTESTELLTQAQADRRTWLSVAHSYLAASEVDRIVEAQVGLPAPDDALTLTLTDASSDQEAVADQAAAMADVTARSAESLRDLETAATQRAVEAATATRNAALQQATVLGIVAGAVVLVGLLLLVVLLRGVVRPLRQLTTLADRVRTTLPETVEQVASGAQAGESVFDGPFGAALTNRPDELGELARAIRASTDEATRVAADQAATRAGVARTIEDVARREQMLVERQLSLLDQLEDAEEDPDQLAQLFRLDHLATRMRRNAENLLLLSSGRLPGGHDATPVSLVDVVRTAAAEIEQYSRVDVRVGVAATVVGYASTPLSHLLAELIENATQFSPPTSRVSVGARLVPQGVVVSIRDRGIAMSEGEIADARRKLAAPPLL